MQVSFISGRCCREQVDVLAHSSGCGVEVNVACIEVNLSRQWLT